MPAAPARRQSAAFSGVTPPSANTGTGAAARQACSSNASPVPGTLDAPLPLPTASIATLSRITFSNTGANRMQSGDCCRANVTSSIVWQETLITGARVLPPASKMRRTSSGDSASGPDGRCTPSASAANATSTLPFTRTLGAMAFSDAYRANNRSRQLDLLAGGKIFLSELNVRDAVRRPNGRQFHQARQGIGFVARIETTICDGVQQFFFRSRPISVASLDPRSIDNCFHPLVVLSKMRCASLELNPIHRLRAVTQQPPTIRAVQRIKLKSGME